MNKYNYIGEEVWHLTPYFAKAGETFFDSENKSYKFRGCPINGLRSNVSRGRIDLYLRNNNKIRIDGNSKCFVVPVENGYLSGSFVLFEELRASTKSSVYILNEGRVLHLADINDKLSMADIDQMVSNDYLVHVVASEMNAFDTSKTMQWYQIMLSDLPQSCLADSNFKKDVLKVFSKLGEVELTTNVAREFINVDYCKRYAEEYFKRECEKYKNLETVK